ncbi:MAG: RNA 2',3'-cyclic phosphodiesterase [Anaerolinea sp.]|nr:RNA 2',3'-cyclic phosphodiesterase [Anaerolinea sp.]
MEEKLRAFIAIELDPVIKGVIHSFESGLKPRSPSGLRWVKTDQLHLTLKFLGDINQTQAKEVSLAISRVVAEKPPFTLLVGKTGAFPNWRNPRTLWIGLNMSNELDGLFQQLDAALGSLGFTPEGKPFSPHLTLSRVSDTVDPRMVQPLQKEFDAFPVASLSPWHVSEVVLFKSVLQPGGPIYTPISRHTLKLSQKM